MKSPGYRLGKKLAEITGTWIYGGEYPYSRKELKQRMEKAGFNVEREMGGEFLFSFGWLFAPIWMRSRKLLMRSLQAGGKESLAKLNYKNPLADRAGRVIAAWGTKK